MSSSVVGQLLFDPTTGSLTFNGVRYLLIRPETVMDLQKAVEPKLGEATEVCFAEGGATGGRLSSARYSEVFGHTAEETVRFMASMGAEIGWGRFELVELDLEGRRLVVEVHGSPFAEGYGESDHPVCHLIRGVLAGVGETVFRGAVTARETGCVACGDGACRFEVEG